jgi:membrane protein
MRLPSSGRWNVNIPTQDSYKDWKRVSWQVYDGFQKDRVLLIAAGVTFYGLLAVFPATAAVVSLYSLFLDASGINTQMQLLAGFLPDGALNVISNQVNRIVGQGHTTLSAALGVTFFLALWGANAGTKAIFDALNIIYELEEVRGLVTLTVSSLLFTLAAMLLMLLALVSVVGVPILFAMLGIPRSSGAAAMSVLRWPLLYVSILFALACLYRYGPSRTQPRWHWITWGSAIAAGIWLIGSWALSWYVPNFGAYNATYGSLGAVIGFMVWMWLSTIVVLVGAEIEVASDATRGTRPRSVAKRIAGDAPQLTNAKHSRRAEPAGDRSGPQ